MNTTRQQQIALIIHANVSGLFAMMLNDKYRGSKFKWSNFPDICRESSAEWIYLHIPKHTEEEKQFAANTASQLAQHLLDRSGLLNSQYEQIGFAYIARKSGEVYISHNEASKHRFPIYRKI